MQLSTFIARPHSKALHNITLRIWRRILSGLSISLPDVFRYNEVPVQCTLSAKLRYFGHHYKFSTECAVKKFENQSIFGDDMDESLLLSFW